jgi:hypothetical protein
LPVRELARVDEEGNAVHEDNILHTPEAIALTERLEANRRLIDELRAQALREGQPSLEIQKQMIQAVFEQIRDVSGAMLLSGRCRHAVCFAELTTETISELHRQIEVLAGFTAIFVLSAMTSGRKEFEHEQ